MTPDKQWFINAYDRAAREEGAASTPEKLRDAVARLYAEGVDLGKLTRVQRTVDDEGRDLAAKYVNVERGRRRTSILEDGAHLLAALRDETILGRNDPYLDMAYPIGDRTDKTLRFWTSADWGRSRKERHANSEKVRAAAIRYDEEVVTPMIAELEKHGVVTTGELPFQEEPDGGEE